MTEKDDVAFLDDVFLAFETDLSFFFGGGDTASSQEVTATDDFGADEAFLDVAVDGPGSFDGGFAFVDGPSTDFGFAGSEELDEAQEVVGGADEAIEAGLF